MGYETVRAAAEKYERRFLYRLLDRGEALVELENDAQYELHFDIEISDCIECGGPEIQFTDGNGEDHSFCGEDVVDVKRHRSARIDEGFSE